MKNILYLCDMEIKIKNTLLRLPETLHESIKNAAKNNGRSLHAEMLHALKKKYKSVNS